MATLKEFHAFHSMVCNPLSAQKCIEAFTNGTHGQEEQEQGVNYRSESGRSSSGGGGGCILFMPSSYRQISSRSDQLKEIKLHDATRSLSIITYYALVVVSLTGLSTLLGLTEFIEVTDFSRSGSGSGLGSSARMENHAGADSTDTDSAIPMVIWPIVENHPPSSETPKRKRTECSRTRNDLLKSKVDPQVVVDDVVFEYIVERHRNLSVMRKEKLLNVQTNETKMGHDTSINKSTNGEIPTVEIKLVRRFEYYFRLVGLSVIMLHFTSTTATTSSSSKVDEGSNTDGGNMDSDDVLHLVEVYHIRNPTLRAVMSLLFSNLNRLSQFLFRAKDEGKLSAAHLKCD